MLYYKFKNYEEFKELFGIVKHGNGNKSRKNKILLAFIKNKELLHNAVVSGDYTLLHISDITTMKNTVIEKIIRSGGEDETLSYCVNLIGKTYYSSTYGTDGNKGLCEDGDMKAVRYINYEKGEKIFKMKAGKFYRAIILETAYGKTLPETILNFLCEEFASEWQTYSMGKLPKNKLFVNKDFERIYSSDCCEGDFDSCMVDKEQHSFYENAVNASAAYLENEEGKIIARGYNRRNTDKNTISHAELNAIRKASKKLGDWRLEGCTMYVTLEPCQMCSGAIVQSRMTRVVVGCMNPKAGCAGSILNLLDMPEFNHQVELTTGVMEEECSQMMKSFFKELREARKKKKQLEKEQTEEI